jgi:hypothetical protein
MSLEGSKIEKVTLMTVRFIYSQPTEPQVWWQDAKGDLHMQGDLAPGSSLQLKSFNGHTFVVKDSDDQVRWRGVVDSSNGANQYVDVDAVTTDKDEL